VTALHANTFLETPDEVSHDFAAFREKFCEFLAQCFAANLASFSVHSRRLSISSNPRGRSRTCLNQDSLAAMIFECGAKLGGERLLSESVSIFLNSMKKREKMDDES
jgi:hypothetical protein